MGWWVEDRAVWWLIRVIFLEHSLFHCHQDFIAIRIGMVIGRSRWGSTPGVARSSSSRAVAALKHLPMRRLVNRCEPGVSSQKRMTPPSGLPSSQKSVSQ